MRSFRSGAPSSLSIAPTLATTASLTTRGVAPSGNVKGLAEGAMAVEHGEPALGCDWQADMVDAPGSRVVQGQGGAGSCGCADRLAGGLLDRRGTPLAV